MSDESVNRPLSDAARQGVSDQRLGQLVRWLAERCTVLEIDAQGDSFRVASPGVFDCYADSLNAAVLDACREMAEVLRSEMP